MASSTEMRVPFLDYRLVERLASTPVEQKLRKGWTKHVFREALAPLMPAEITWRRDKKGFALPLDAWARQYVLPMMGQLRQGGLAMHDLGLVSPEGLQQVVSEFSAGQIPTGAELFQVPGARRSGFGGSSRSMPSPEVGRPPLLVRTLTIWRLGPVNLARVALRRARARLGLFLKRTPRSGGIGSPRCESVGAVRPVADPGAITEAEALLAGTMLGFGGREVAFEFPPRWQLNRLSGRTSSFAAPWFGAQDFDPEFGDIKGVWEASRFDWALVLARAAAQGHVGALERLNALLADWSEHNPAYSGLNWVCGQETAIRLVQLLLAARLVAGESDGASLVGFVGVHVERIRDTLGYAIAQDNDHGFSETGGLFIAGEWLVRHATSPAQRRLGAKASRLARRWLEDRVARLVLDDGGTSNYSSNYHRTIVDWLCQVELWRRALDVPAFSERFYDRARRATLCLDALTNEASGEAPNMGGNDGAWVFRLHSLPYGDFRPSVQLASALFAQHRRYPSGPWDLPLAWWGLDAGVACRCEREGEPAAGSLRSAGPRSRARLVLRLPSRSPRTLSPAPGRPAAFRLVDRLRAEPAARFRLLFLLRRLASGRAAVRRRRTPTPPSSMATSRCAGYRRLPLRRLDRRIHPGAGSACDSGAGVVARASYRDRLGCRHERTVTGRARVWTIRDRLEGFQETAILRWRLCDTPWRLEGNRLVGEAATLVVSAQGSPLRLELTTGGVAKAYGARTETPLLEAHVSQAPCEIVTEIALA